MNIIVNKKTLLQYTLIYFMLLCQGSHLYGQSELAVSVIILSVCAILIFKNKALITGNIIFLCLLLTVTVIFVRLQNNGGAGLSVLVEDIARLLIMYIAYSYNKKDFMHNFVTLVTCFAVISLIFYFLSMVSSGFVIALSPFHIFNRNYGTTFHGLLLYVLRESEISRNTGIYTEPGLYQIVLCTCLYFLLFNEKYINIDTKKRGRYLFIIILTILTTRSASGYLGLLFLIVVYILSEKDRYKQKVLLVLGLFTAVVGADLILNKESSILSKYFLQKIIDDSNRINLNAASGLYRIQVIEVCMETIRRYPFGLGYDNVNSILASKYPGAAGAALAVEIMALGILPVLIIIAVFIRQSVINRLSLYHFLIFIFFFLNASLAQSSIFYPALLVIVYIENRKMADQNREELIHA